MFDIINWFNTLETKNEYNKRWLGYFGTNITFTIKNNWVMSDIIDVKDYNTLKSHINLVANALNITPALNIDTTNNQNLTQNKVDIVNKRVNDCINNIGNKQYKYNICGLAICGGGGIKV